MDTRLYSLIWSEDIWDNWSPSEPVLLFFIFRFFKFPGRIESDYFIESPSQVMPPSQTSRRVKASIMPRIKFTWLILNLWASIMYLALNYMVDLGFS